VIAAGDFCTRNKPMIIHTVSSLRTTGRRLASRLERAELVLNQMERGAALHLQHSSSGPIWTLTNGEHVTNSVARLVVASSSIIAVGDALFRDVRSQTYRWWNSN
jgi:hypothetical protein